MSFLFGVFVCCFSQKCERNDLSYQNHQVFSFCKSQIDSFNVNLDNYRLVLSRYNIKDELAICQQLIYVYSNFPVVEYNILNHRNNQKIVSAISDTVLSILSSINKEHLTNDYKDLILSLINEKTKDNDKLYCLYLVENLLMNSYLSYVYQNSICLSYGELLNITSKDIIKLGETYRSQLIFSIKDISGNKGFVEMLNDTVAKQIVLDGNTFIEKPTRRGKHNHDFVLFLSGFYGNRGWSTSVDYEVK